MPNHYHLLVRTPLGNLGQAMRHLDGIYTQLPNRLRETDGPLFRGRYKAILVDANAYLLAVSRYVHRNPFNAARPRVENLADWQWSSYPAYINRTKGPNWLRTEATYAMLDQRNRYAGYQNFVEAGVEEEVARFYANQRATPVLGDEAFRAWAREQGADSREAPRMRCWPPWPKLGTWRQGRSPATGRQLGPRERQVRQIAMLLCWDETAMTLAAIGELFGGIHYSAVGQNIRRVQTGDEGRSRTRSFTFIPNCHVNDLSPKMKCPVSATRLPTRGYPTVSHWVAMVLLGTK